MEVRKESLGLKNSMVTNEAGTVISRAADVRVGETIRVSFSSGSLNARVEQIQEDAT